MTIKTRIKEVTEYYEKCKFCDKEIIGASQSAIPFNMDVHIKAAHPEEYRRLNHDK